ncbi:hypothetical protein AB0D08_15340 [Kitasatospora sp. NPDC048540]|uniref:hypothetical protein n=1 Tax=unclassified Kitasatospora TaxID=2633591 RepID=UPI00053A6813|nr:hypothetical protein [Kitasatospora sp. MBT63]
MQAKGIGKAAVWTVALATVVGVWRTTAGRPPKPVEAGGPGHPDIPPGGGGRPPQPGEQAATRGTTVETAGGSTCGPGHPAK